MEPNKQFDDIIKRAAEKYGIDEGRIRRIIEAESGFDPRAVSGVGAQGLMQLMPDTAKELGINDPFDPEQNIMGGARYLNKMAGMFPGDEDKQHAAYNFGPGNVQSGKKWPKETQDYVAKLRSPSPENTVTETEGSQGQTYTDEQGRELYIEGNPSPEEVEEIFASEFPAGVGELPVSAGFDQPPDMGRVLRGTIPGQLVKAAESMKPPADTNEAIARGLKQALIDPGLGALEGIINYPKAAAERAEPFFQKGFEEDSPLRFGQGALALLPFAGEIVDPANKMLTGMGKESSEGASDVLSNIINLGMVSGGANEAIPGIAGTVGKGLRNPIMQDLAGAGVDFALRKNPYEAGAMIPARRMLKAFGADPVSSIMDAIAKPFDWIGKYRGILGEGGIIPSGKTAPALPNKISGTSMKPATVNPPNVTLKQGEPATSVKAPPEPKITPEQKVGNFTIPSGYRVKSIKNKPEPVKPSEAVNAETVGENYHVSPPPETKGPLVNEGYIRELLPEETIKSVREKNLFNRVVEGKPKELLPKESLPEGVEAQRLNAEGEFETVTPKGRPKGSTTRDKGTNLRATGDNPRSQLEKLRKDYDEASRTGNFGHRRDILEEARKHKKSSSNFFQRFFGDIK